MTFKALKFVTVTGRRSDDNIYSLILTMCLTTMWYMYCMMHTESGEKDSKANHAWFRQKHMASGERAQEFSRLILIDFTSLKVFMTGGVFSVWPEAIHFFRPVSHSTIGTVEQSEWYWLYLINSFNTDKLFNSLPPVCVKKWTIEPLDHSIGSSYKVLSHGTWKNWIN